MARHDWRIGVILKRALLGLLLIGAIFLWNCHIKETSRPIIIGLSVNLSGATGAPSDDIRDGAILGVKEVNQNGGVRGRPIQLLIRDDHNTKEGVLRADQELIDAGAVVIIGHSYSQNTLIAYPLVTGAGRVLFTGYTATSKLSGIDDLFIRTSVDDTMYAKAFDLYLKKRGFTRLAFLVDISNPSFSLDIFRLIGKSGSRYRLWYVEYDSRRPGRFKEIAQELLEGDPEAIILLTEVKGTGILAQKLRELGYKGLLMASIWAYGPRLFTFGDDAVEGLILISMLKPKYDNPGYKLFERNYRDEFGRSPTVKAARAYEAIWILWDALSRIDGKITGNALKESLLAGNYTTILGHVAFDKFGDVRRPIYALRATRGNFVVEEELFH